LLVALSSQSVCWSLSGLIDERTPGGWFVLKDVHASTELGFPLVVGPRHIEFIPKKYKATVTEMACSLVKDYNVHDMMTTYQDYLTKHFRYISVWLFIPQYTIYVVFLHFVRPCHCRAQIQTLMDRIKSLKEEASKLTRTLNWCQSEDSFSRSPEEIERYRSRQRTVLEL
jgi:hypothetical protein